MSLVDRLSAGEFEFGLSVAQATFYRLERALGGAFFRRPPPEAGEPRLLNLGCGPHIFEGWVNADDYAFKRGLREAAFRPNWRLDITRPWNCPADHWDGVFTEHVLEHVSYSEAIFVMRECLRTMKRGACLRISVPDVRTYVDFYEGRLSRPQFAPIPHPAVGISFLTQMHLHRSAWDADLMTRVLTEIGFADARAVSFGVGADARLVRDDPDKAHESLYVEARKP
jgi:predicted SAM-dependent methyltransferase